MLNRCKFRHWALLLLALTLWRGNTLFAETALEPTPKLKYGGLFQVWIFNDTSLSKAWLNFRLRRAELRANIQAAESVEAFIMLDPAKSLNLTSDGKVDPSADNKILQDLGIRYRLGSTTAVTVGQFRIPTTAEGLRPSEDLWLPERSLVGRTYGYRRQPGLKFSYQSGPFQWETMIATGSGTNVLDSNNSKDIVTRFEFHSGQQLSAGVFGWAPNISLRNAGTFGINLDAEIEKLGLRSEAVYSYGMPTEAVGVNVELSYRVAEKFQVVGRVEAYKQNLNGNITADAVTVGANYLLAQPGLKIQLAGSRIDKMYGVGGTPEFTPALGPHTLIQLSFQAPF